MGARSWTLFFGVTLSLLAFMGPVFLGSCLFSRAVNAEGMAGAAASAGGPVDMALVLAVDVSGSVDDQRFSLQMDGVATAFESAAVQRAVLSGPRNAILVAFVQWSNKPKLVIPWTRLTNASDIKAFAIRLRAMRRLGGDFTCMSNMMQYVADKLFPLAPVQAGRRILDISGDGRDNCNGARSVDALRDDLVSQGATVNGLPVVTTGRDDALERWFADHVVGGEQSFVMPAFGYDDFGRAIQQKLVSEISGLQPPPFLSSRSNRTADR